MPNSRPLDLPEFERPPIIEVALSIQFATLPLFRNIHAGILWQRFAQQYPNVEEYPPIPAAFETFGVPPAISEMPQFTFVTNSPIRYWFITADGTELLQVQAQALNGWARGRRCGAGVVRHPALARALAAHPQLNVEQAALVTRWCTSGDRVQAAVGRAGTGKTTTMRVAADAWRNAASGRAVVMPASSFPAPPTGSLRPAARFIVGGSCASHKAANSMEHGLCSGV